MNNGKMQVDRKRIILLGCGGHARSIISTIFEKKKNIEILLVDQNAEANEYILGCTVQCKYDIQKNDEYIIAIGDNVKRRELYKQLSTKQIGFCISVISEYAYIGTSVEVGEGTFIAPNAYIGPLAKIGSNTIINTASVIEHEVIIGNHTHIAPQSVICGRTRIGNNVFCGAGSKVVDQISICDDVVIGAGAVVIHDITEKGTYVGIPARKLIDRS